MKPAIADIRVSTQEAGQVWLQSGCAGLMKPEVAFIVADLGSDTDPSMLHLYAALAEKERQVNSQRRNALAAAKQNCKCLGGRVTMVVRRQGGRNRAVQRPWRRCLRSWRQAREIARPERSQRCHAYRQAIVCNDRHPRPGALAA